MNGFALATLSPPRRLVVGAFLALMLGFYLLAQAQLFVAVGGGRSYPGPEAVLARYHGDPTKSSGAAKARRTAKTRGTAKTTARRR